MFIYMVLNCHVVWRCTVMQSHLKFHSVLRYFGYCRAEQSNAAWSFIKPDKSQDRDAELIKVNTVCILLVHFVSALWFEYMTLLQDVMFAFMILCRLHYICYILSILMILILHCCNKQFICMKTCAYGGGHGWGEVKLPNFCSSICPGIQF